MKAIMAHPQTRWSTNLPHGWRLHKTTTIGGQDFWHVEHICGDRLRGNARLGELHDHEIHECQMPDARTFRSGESA